MVTIVQKEAPILRETAHAVSLKDIGTSRLQKILHDMKTALDREDDGVAIAAPQIGVPLRIFLVSHRAFSYKDDPEKHENICIEKVSVAPQSALHEDIVFINPEIIKLSRKKVWLHEGCLSVRFIYGEVSRADKATIRAYDENGKQFTRGGSGLLAQIFQHETDHLNGVLFIDSARALETITREEQEERRKENEATNHDK